MWKRNSNWRIFEKKNELNLTAIWNRTENDNNSTFTYIFLTSCKNSHYQLYMSYVLFITDSLELSTQEFDIGTPAINKIVHITHRDCGFIIICWAPIFMNFVIESTPRKSNVNRSKWITWQKVVLVKQLSTYLQILENENNSWTIKILMPRDFDEPVLSSCLMVYKVSPWFWRAPLGGQFVVSPVSHSAEYKSRKNNTKHLNRFSNCKQSMDIRSKINLLYIGLLELQKWNKSPVCSQSQSQCSWNSPSPAFLTLFYTSPWPNEINQKAN